MQINSLPASSGVSNTDIVPLQTTGNITQKATVQQISDRVAANITLPDTSKLAELSTGSAYPAGYGGSVTQVTTKSTAVTINKTMGQIITSSAAMAANSKTSFTVNNSLVGTADIPLVVLASGPANANNYTVSVQAVGSGVFTIMLQNTSAGSLSEALTLNFVVLKGATA